MAKSLDYSTLKKDRPRRNWLVDHCREGAGKGLERPLGCPPNARFSVASHANPPKEYLSGPMSFSVARATKRYLERVWGAECVHGQGLSLLNNDNESVREAAEKTQRSNDTIHLTPPRLSL